MKKKELVAAIADQCGMKRTDVDKVIDAFMNVVTNELKDGGKVALVGFGTFEVGERGAREGRNPKSGETMVIPASRNAKFKPSKTLKDAMNE